MRKTLQILLLTLLVGSAFQVQAEEVEFLHDWDEALAAAQKENKPIFLDAYTTWCGPCKWMSANVFTDDKVAAFYNENFINLKLDMEAGDGLTVAEMFKVRVYPSLLFLDPQGQIVHRAAGAISGPEFIELGQAALDTEEPLHELYAAYESGEYDRSTLYRYAMHGSKVGLNVSEAIEEYKQGLKPEDLMTEEGWAFYFENIYDVDGELFAYFQENKQALSDEFGEDVIETKYFRNYLTSMEQAVRNKDAEKVEAYAEVLDGQGDENLQYYYRSILVKWIKTSESRESAYQQIDQWVKEGQQMGSNALNSYAWEVYEAEEIDPEYIEMAIDWVEKSIEMERNPYNVDTHAMLLWKNGNLDRAIEVAEEAIALAKDAGEDASATEASLAKMRAEKSN